MQHWLINARLFDGSEWLDNMHVCVEDDTIAAVTSTLPEHLPEHYDCWNQQLVPAFIDAQIYGGGGRLFPQYPEPESLALLAAENRKGGTAQCLVTIPTMTVPAIKDCLAAVHTYIDEGGDGILGLHLEGPFINKAKRGAHVADWVIEPTPDLIRQLLDAARGHLKMITLAPECCSDDVLCLLQEAGVIISAGHCNASYEQAQHFSRRGITAVTHLFNAMSPLHHRAPGLPMAVFEDKKLRASIIPDGLHVDFSLLRMAKQIMGERLFYITDSVTPADAGAYRHQLVEGSYALPDGTLSGSALTMLQAVKNGIEHAGFQAEESLRMASLYPAQLLHLSEHYGSIGVGKKASMLLISDDWELVKVFGF